MPIGQLLCDTCGLEAPKGLAHVNAFSNTPAQNLGLMGDVCWLVAYVCFVYLGVRRKTYCVPMAALWLNITWEFLFTFCWPPRQPGSGQIDMQHFALYAIWCLLDLGVVTTLLLYGRPQQTLKPMRRHFRAWNAAAFGLALVGNLTFFKYHGQNSQYEFAYLMNLMMSVLFVFMLFNRTDLNGISRGGAWFKGVGTTLVSISCILQSPPVNAQSYYFLLLYVACFFFDAMYIAMVEHAFRASACLLTPQVGGADRHGPPPQPLAVG